MLQNNSIRLQHSAVGSGTRQRPPEEERESAVSACMRLFECLRGGHVFLLPCNSDIKAIK